MDIPTLKKQLKGASPAMVYTVVGTQMELQAEARQAFLDLIPAEEQVMNVASYDLEATPLDEALADAMEAPFFGERRLVFLNKPTFLTGSTGRGSLKQDPDLLKEYLNHPEPTTTLVIMAPYEKLDGRKGVVKSLKKVAVEVSAAPLDESQARHIVEARFQKDGFILQNGAMDELVRRTNADYGQMMSHVQQLETYAYPGKDITIAAVQGLVPQSLDENVFDLVQAVLDQHQVMALDDYQQLLAAQQQPLQINAVLVSQFRLLLQVKILSQRGLSQGTITQQLKVHPYRVQLAQRTAQKYDLATLCQAYQGLIQIERDLKTTSRSTELLFQLFMLKFNKAVD